MFHPKLKTCTIVPVGLTEHRKGLMDLKTVDSVFAELLLEQLPELRSRFSGDQSPFVLLSDEWYILGDKQFPLLTDYGDADLVENGVGQVQNFLSQFEKESLQFPSKLERETNIIIATGTLVKDIFRDKVLPTLNQIKNMAPSSDKIEHIVTIFGVILEKEMMAQNKLAMG